MNDKIIYSRDLMEILRCTLVHILILSASEAEISICTSDDQIKLETIYLHNEDNYFVI